MTDAAVYPITLYDPDSGIVRDFADAAALLAGLPTFDTDQLAPSSRRWLIDGAGRRVRARIAFGRVERLEILPGRPPLAETLTRLRERALSTEEDRDVDARAALVAARIAGAILGPFAAVSLTLHWWPWLTNLVFAGFDWDLPVVSVAAIGAALLATVWCGSRRWAFLGLTLLCVCGALLGALRGWRLMAAFTAPGSALALPTLLLQWTWELAMPGLMFVLSSLLLVFYGKTYRTLARRRR